MIVEDREVESQGGCGEQYPVELRGRTRIATQQQALDSLGR